MAGKKTDDPLRGRDALRERVEEREWTDSFDEVVSSAGEKRAARLLGKLQIHAARKGIKIPHTANTPYVNTIPPGREPPFPGDREIERRIKNIIRWNAMAMVVRANRNEEGIGGHISTYASAATLLEVAFNHFLKAGENADMVYFQGHASPGIYARAFLEGRVSLEQMKNFRREAGSGRGLSSYPHPWLMPDFWEFPTVSMGLSPIMGIYQARFNRYLQNRGLIEQSQSKVWVFLGDGESDEPETLGAITLAAREKLDNLIFVINCNLQRLDGPVRGNGKIIQELEAIFRGAGWEVIKAVWGADWDPLLEKDTRGLLAERMAETVDGEYQKYVVESGDYIRSKFFGTHPLLLDMVKNLADEQLERLARGGHDPQKVFAAYDAAVKTRGAPAVVLAKTVKGYGIGEASEGRNITHQQKKLNEEELQTYRTRLRIPIPDEDLPSVPFYKPPENSGEIRYLKERRKALGGPSPSRANRARPLAGVPEKPFGELLKGSGGRGATTTMAFVRMLAALLKDPAIGKLVVPIVPDEARTFGMEPLFRQVGIYASEGQKYEPVDSDTLLYYREAKDGQILEEGITEAGAMSSFIAAGSAHATHGINSIPFFVFYSMFGLQRIGDLAWAAGDMRCRGFLIGGTSGKTTLAGEGLQHQDGSSHQFSYAFPTMEAYDPAFAYELAVIVREGMKRMYCEGEDIFYYITVTNEPYPQPPMPKGKNIEEGIMRGMYRFKKSPDVKNPKRAHLLGSGAILNEAIVAAEILEKQYGVAADVWSVTSYKELYRDSQAAERWNRIHPAGKKKIPYIQKCLGGESGVFVAASDYMKSLPSSISRLFPGRAVELGTDGFGRSDTRAKLREHFEVDANNIAYAALWALAEEGKIKGGTLEKAAKELGINPRKKDPMFL
ncbi:MAG: pyruvate dehydrogenase (acetyl-transferring), homodimeric type [Candidatus Dadabacteria bacterium]|nr:pyruvate dehydrogenase (acetyl-transferring), homodimeric type [Candidatus Dadabacteria bacterium]